MRIGSDYLGPAHAPVTTTFDLAGALATARTALRRGTALLAIGDWYELTTQHVDLLESLAAWCDCTALVTRDPWYDGLPLGGIVRFAGAEGGRLRTYVGRRERQSFARAVRVREDELLACFSQAGWRTGILHETDGAASLRAAFGVAQ